MDVFTLEKRRKYCDITSQIMVMWQNMWTIVYGHLEKDGTRCNAAEANLDVLLPVLKTAL